MKTTSASLTLLLILIVNGQRVYSRETLAGTDESMAEHDTVDLDGNTEESPIEAQVSFYRPARTFVQSIYGTYNPARCCWKSGPRAPRPRVRNHCQSVAVRRKIECRLSKNVAVKRAISKNAKHCDLKHHQESEGILDTCPSSYHRATEVWFFGKKCYIVRPNQQCVTYKRCYRKSDCATNDGNSGDGSGDGSGDRSGDGSGDGSGGNDGNGGKSGAKRSTFKGLISRRSETSKGGGCYGTYMSSSACLPDDYRTFQVWIFCDFCGFKLINLELPQCCLCKRYNHCDDVIPQN